LKKRKGKKRRAAATAAYRARGRARVVTTIASADSNRSTCPLAMVFEGDRLPEEACCAHCGRRGRVRMWC
jgi:hypothetical protein